MRRIAIDAGADEQIVPAESACAHEADAPGWAGFPFGIERLQVVKAGREKTDPALQIGGQSTARALRIRHQPIGAGVCMETRAAAGRIGHPAAGPVDGDAGGEQQRQAKIVAGKAALARLAPWIDIVPARDGTSIRTSPRIAIRRVGLISGSSEAR